MTRDEDVRRKLSRTALGQGMIWRKPIDIVITVEYDRTAPAMASWPFAMSIWKRATWDKVSPPRLSPWAWAR